MNLEAFEQPIKNQKELNNLWNRISCLALEIDFLNYDIIEKKLEKKDYKKELVEREIKKGQFKFLLAGFQNLLKIKGIKIDLSRIKPSSLSREIILKTI